MAGRPVAARGGNGMLYGLIAFVIVAVASLGAFVWQLTGNQELVTANERSQSELQKYGRPPSYYSEEAGARRSKVFDVMDSDIQALAQLIYGKPEAVRPAIVEGANQLLTQAVAAGTTVKEGDSLMGAMTKLLNESRELQARVGQLTAELATSQLAKQAAEDNLKTVRDEFQEQVALLQEELDQVSDQNSEQLAAKDEQLARQQSESEAIGEELSRARVTQQTTDRNHEIELFRLKEDLNALQDQIAVLKPGGFDPYDILTKADGRVLRAIPGSDVIYINLGEKDRIRPGLTFEIFSPTGDGSDTDFRGKASVEVAAVMESTAECLVTRATRGRPIVENDIIVNIVYERNRLPKFVIRGEFDLDYNGQVDWNGVEKVTAIVQAWGGQVVDTVDEGTDFMVVGMGPRVPEIPGTKPVSEVIRNLADSRLNDLVDFQHDVDSARTLYIPVITQSQFLYLTGYSGIGPIMTE